ncbi:SDR family oxidoreductase [Gordonia sp. (in: high G+C Gram-positive bacteria)]|jgi:NAD(P)-dependent dehydrogenase (short-subunit alcohol dehydrogenase family)|uniref:SDR family NAD(P)-dependent oxidoreductase n=2 Tax=Gordonia sp. (in: high G+C Gram-positive bacteria) TaxID=84139 RepID=UPI0026103921|nr:SDR family oxidoreductase [Gordonia sp. (in: high G+C Gram-positive bacteria)]HMS77172.1 SDR family oxidoreductase [Gordonia sp. (in: high G+C Gram-positive bacteria)]HQV18050.1 SDR family oxidoreductase [Gordonia sp. (in: high G+C Gram-positive bacteria)]
MKDFRDKVVVVTGAGSGIGRELAVKLAQKGAKVAISDVDAAGLATTERLVREAGAQVHTQTLNVTERQAVLDYAETVATHFGGVNAIFNNAGIAHHGEVEHTDFKDIERVIDIDFWGVVNGTKAFLPYLIASGDGHVINVSSLFGLLAEPGQAAYNAAKFAVRGFTEALNQEMIVAKHPVKVTCVHPGGIKTAIARNATTSGEHDQKATAEFFDKYLAHTSAAKAADVILDGVRKGKARVLIGADAKILDLSVRLVASKYQGVGARVTAFALSKAK